IAWNQPIHIILTALFKSLTEAGIPHLAGVHAPRVQDLRVLAYCAVAKLGVRAIFTCAVMGFAIDDRDWPGVASPILVQLLDQTKESFEIGQVFSGLEGVNNYRMNETALLASGALGFRVGFGFWFFHSPILLMVID